MSCEALLLAMRLACLTSSGSEARFDAWARRRARIDCDGMQARSSRKLLDSCAEWFTGYCIGIGQSAHPKTTMHDCASWLNAGRVIELHVGVGKRRVSPFAHRSVSLGCRSVSLGCRGGRWVVETLRRGAQSVDFEFCAKKAHKMVSRRVVLHPLTADGLQNPCS